MILISVLFFCSVYIIFINPHSLEHVAILSVNCIHVEAKIYSLTDIFLDHRFQNSKHGSNCARSSDATRHTDAVIVFDTRIFCSTQ